VVASPNRLLGRRGEPRLLPGHPQYPRAFLALLFVVNLLNYIDRFAITGLIEPIRKDLGTQDAQMGMVGLAFTLTYSLLPPVFGWLGDQLPRTLIIGSSCAFWSVATAVTGLSQKVWQLAVMRGAVGIGEASYMSNAPGLVADLYPPAKRGSAMSLFYIAAPVGAAVGVTLGGVLGSSFGWRIACLLVALPGVIAAIAVWRLPEPVRGQFEEGLAVVPTSLWETARQLIGNRVFVLLTLAYTAQIFLQNAVEFWLPTVLQRDKGISLLEANTAYGAAGLVAGIAARSWRLCWAHTLRPG
jgi:MFS family permease